MMHIEFTEAFQRAISTNKSPVPVQSESERFLHDQLVRESVDQITLPTLDLDEGFSAAEV